MALAMRSAFTSVLQAERIPRSGRRTCKGSIASPRHYEAQWPTHKADDVLIAGGGQVGLALALALARRGADAFA